MLIRTPACGSSAIHCGLLNCPPWSLWQISGTAWVNARCMGLSTKGSARLWSNSQLST